MLTSLKKSKQLRREWFFERQYPVVGESGIGSQELSLQAKVRNDWSNGNVQGLTVKQYCERPPVHKQGGLFAKVNNVRIYRREQTKKGTIWAEPRPT